VNQLWQVILYAKKIFYSLEKDLESEDPGLASHSNELSDMFYAEASKLFREDQDTFQLKVAETVAECHAKLYELPHESNDANSIIFGPWNPQIHEELRQKLLSTNRGATLAEDSEPSETLPSLPSANGLSWVQKGSTRTFSKTVS
jgi:hypothetical protein